VALRPELASVFEQLTRPLGPQIVLQPVSSLLPDAERVRFEALERAAAERGEIALGLHRGGPGGLALNPGRDAEWSLRAEDQLVCLTSFADGNQT
jgi:hypothetical protein